MKKTYSILVICLAITTYANAQVVFNVEQPTSLSGNYGLTYAEPGSWGVPDLLNPANAVLDTLAFVDDGTIADSLGCDPLINGTNVNGKIAVVYRGSCQFGTKSLNAQTEGAVAVVIINNVPGGPINMAGGDDGPNVNIPVVMISDVDGAALRNEILNGNVVAFIGNKTGFYNNDIGMETGKVIRSKSFSTPLLLAQNASEYEVQMGSWIKNYGLNDQLNVTLFATITYNGNQIYSNVSSPADILSGDSAYFTLPTFSQPSYTTGYYTVEYTAILNATDEFPNDNTINADFVLDDHIFSYCRLDKTNLKPRNINGFRSANSITSRTCIQFQDPNASRIAVSGITFSTTTNATANIDLTGETIDFEIHEWGNNFAGLSDANIDVTGIFEIALESYQYLADDQGTSVTGTFPTPIALEDNKRYLFCVSNFNEDYFAGYDTGIDYAENKSVFDQPIEVIQSDNGWFVEGFTGTDDIPAIAVNMIDVNSIGVEENEDKETIKAFPIPTTDKLTIPLPKRYNGKVQLNIYDLSGKLIDGFVTNQTRVLEIEVNKYQSGTYMFELHSENETDTFKVVITK